MLKKAALVLTMWFLSISTFGYNIDPQRVFVSGLSSGSYMAGQVHIAYSSVFKGAGLLAGGPYYCAQNNLNRALSLCSDRHNDLPNVEDLADYAREFERDRQIDPLHNLVGHKIAVLVGDADEVVPLPLTRLNVDFYNQISSFTARPQLFRVTGMGHAFPTLDRGNACGALRQTPFISRCGFDGAGTIMNHLEENLASRGVARRENFYSFDQKLAHADPAAISLASQGAAYVPAACQQGERCGLHVAIHGCRQTPDHIGRAFIEMTGYNEWAETNKTIVIYPQAKGTPLYGNPLGCWDWWGYLGANYATREGAQVKFIKQLVDVFSSSMKLSQR